MIAYAESQLGKPYLWGGTGPDAFDCSGLVMESYLAAGIDIPRTSEQQWTWGPRVSPSQVEPGDLVFFAGADGTVISPGHVGLVIGGGKMIEAYATGFPIRVAPTSAGTRSASPGHGRTRAFGWPPSRPRPPRPASSASACATSQTVAGAGLLDRDTSALRKPAQSRQSANCGHFA